MLPNRSSREAPKQRDGVPTFAGLKSREAYKSMSDTAERVKKIVVEHLNVDAEKVTDTASFIEDLGADSLDTVELVMAFEEDFGIEIPDDAAESIVTVGDAVKYIDKANASRSGDKGLKPYAQGRYHGPGSRHAAGMRRGGDLVASSGWSVRRQPCGPGRQRQRG